MSLTTTQSGLKRIETRWGHRYTLDGEDCPGVTTLIGNGIPKPQLIRWAARVVSEHVADMDPIDLDKLRRAPRDVVVGKLKRVPFTKRDQAAARGTEVHGFAERLIKGEPVDVPAHLHGYVGAAVQFMNDWRPAPLLVEASVASRTHWYCGTVDLICDLPDGRRALMDYKTSASGIWPETALQLAGYRYADFALDADGNEVLMSALGIDCTYAVWLKDGSYEVKPLNTGRDVFECFLTICKTARFLDLMPTWVGATETWSAA